MLRYIRAIIFILLVQIFCTAMPVYAEWTPPADRVPSGGMWNPGISGGIPNRTTIYTTLSETGDSTDRTAAINTAISNAGNNEVVYLNAGTYYVSGTLTMLSNKVLRGAGMDQTYIYKTGTGRPIIAFGSGPSWGGAGNFILDEWEELSSTGTKDATSVSVSDSSGYSAGQLVVIAEGENGNPLVEENGTQGFHAADKMRATTDWPPNDSGELGQTNIIDSINGSTINLVAPLYRDYSTTYTASIGRTTVQITNAGVENLTIQRAECASSNNDSESEGQIYFSRATYCWIKNIEIEKISGPGVNFMWSFGNIMHGCNIHESCTYSSGGGGYQVLLKLYSTNNLIENNIIHQGTPNIHMSPGGGNVVAYNWIDVSVTNGGTPWAVYNVAGHCATPHMNLVEGNVISIMEHDMTWGNSIYFFLLRNHFDARQTESISPLNDTMATTNRSAIDLNTDAHYWTIVGNVLGRDGDSYGAYYSATHGTTTAYIFRQGSDVLDTLLRHGNYDYYDKEVKWCVEENNEADCQGSGNDHDIPNSLYLSSKPSWWDDQGSGRPWPSIGPDINGYVIDIPAKDRFEGETYIPSDSPSPPHVYPLHQPK